MKPDKEFYTSLGYVTEQAMESAFVRGGRGSAGGYAEPRPARANAWVGPAVVHAALPGEGSTPGRALIFRILIVVLGVVPWFVGLLTIGWLAWQ